MQVKFTVLGEPQGKGRPRFARQGNFVRTRTPEQTVIYENLIKTEYRSQCGDKMFPEKEPISITVYAFFEIPKSVSKKKAAAMLSGEIRPTKKPDYDNIGKVVSDSLNKIAFYDDAQVVDGLVRKFHSETPGILVVIQSVDYNENLAEKVLNLWSKEKGKHYQPGCGGR